jgi:hypothetical protein
VSAIVGQNPSAQAACNLIINYQVKYSDEMRRNYSQRCDIVTKTSEKCFVYINSSNVIAIDPAEEIHIIDCYANGDLRGVYVTEDSETCYIGYIDVTADKTDSEELQQLVRTMKYNADCIEKKELHLQESLSVSIPYCISEFFSPYGDDSEPATYQNESFPPPNGRPAHQLYPASQQR